MTSDTGHSILVVDDESFYINVLVDLLREQYRVTVAKSGQQALSRVSSEIPPDLILLDILMPEMDGYEVCKQLKADPCTVDIPVIFLTVKSEVDDEIRGFQLGAVDYITKPMSPPLVLSRVKTHLALSQTRRILKNQNQLLEERVRERTHEISRTQDVAIFCLASLAETRDNETGNHIRRTQHYIQLLANHLKAYPRFQKTLNNEYIDLLFKSAPLHDIGKVGVADKILLKPGKLDPAEWEEMKRHAQYGFDALLRAEQELGSTAFLQLAREICLTHHEKWDGTGYPNGLIGEAIPLSGRLMALADVYDALITSRVYKEAFSHETAVEMIREERGRHFDPEVVRAFLDLEDSFQAIANRFTE
ncbi:response regulator [endosymbiont of Ridgeia piscesae]|jgi:putative two-component system response regulator|uniref:Putative two-component system response regulator n=1 Tax=endosymbiont of Ridgeia piscesae TaxID=54398 RepID=A0A0T5Z8G7_9GAMM|nr:two-component system response regulator [endosymbiont of Ridgeia piscesae]KRT56423.1 Response regulator c-di-GMP phosphodiesterase, RpfG family [endosymbiont of Ridgeia piscesae]KRT59148.1 putative two-component system response regulator [endosymbiont of Ridgeia piscesae]